MRKKKIIALALITLLVTAQFIVGGTDFRDVDDAQWYAPAVSRWGDILADGDLAFPNRLVTRGEFAFVLNSVLGFSERPPTFPDVAQDAEYARAIGALQAAGVVIGRPDSTFDSTGTLRRDEAAVMMARAFGLPAGAVPEFTDTAAIPGELRPYLASLQNFNFITGNPDGSFAPASLLTRAQVFQIIHNAYELHGNMIVTEPGTVLSDKTIEGNLIIAPSVGNGTVTLNNVVLNGELIVRGGGTNSIVIMGNSVVHRIHVDRVGVSGVRISVEGGANVAEVVVNGGLGTVVIDGSVGTVVVAYKAAGTSIELAGTADMVVVSAPAASVLVADTGRVADVVITATAFAVELVNHGNIGALTVENVTVEIVDNGTIETATLPEGVTITGGAEERPLAAPPTIVTPPPNDVYS